MTGNVDDLLRLAEAADIARRNGATEQDIAFAAGLPNLCPTKAPELSAEQAARITSRPAQHLPIPTSEPGIF